MIAILCSTDKIGDSLSSLPCKYSAAQGRNHVCPMFFARGPRGPTPPQQNSTPCRGETTHVPRTARNNHGLTPARPNSAAQRRNPRVPRSATEHTRLHPRTANSALTPPRQGETTHGPCVLHRTHAVPPPHGSLHKSTHATYR